MGSVISIRTKSRRQYKGTGIIVPARISIITACRNVYGYLGLLLKEFNAKPDSEHAGSPPQLLLTMAVRIADLPENNDDTRYA